MEYSICSEIDKPHIDICHIYFMYTSDWINPEFYELFIMFFD